VTRGPFSPPDNDAEGAHWVDAPEVEGLVPEWSALVDRDPEATLFQTPEWVLPWWRHLGQGRLRVLTVRREGRLTTLVPLVERRESVPLVGANLLAFAGEPEADRQVFLSDPDDPRALEAAVTALLDRARSVDIVRLSEVLAGSKTDDVLSRRLMGPGRPAVRRICARAPYLPLGRSWEAIEASYPSTLRTRLRRARKKQQQAGALSFRRWLPGVAELPDLLARFHDVERKSWKGDRGVGVFSTPERRAFFAELSERLAGRGWLDVATLSAGERLVAYRYGFRFRGTFLDYNLAHDPADAHLSPGRVLLDEIVRDSHRLGLETVDASRGQLLEGHLLGDWTSLARWHARWLLFSPSPKGRLLAFAEMRLRPMVRRLRGLEPEDARSAGQDPVLATARESRS
jgi:CelD/BcsL family acetyltransferase involved in cellulose biosynthesis